MRAALAGLPRPLFLLYAGTTLNRLGTFVFPFLTIYLAEGRELSLDLVGRILALGGAGLFLGNLAGGWLADKWSRKGTLILSLVGNAAGFAALSFPQEAPWSYAGMLFGAYLAMGLFGPAAAALIADLTDERQRPFAYTVNYVCINLGMGLGPLLGGLLAASSYRLLFLGDVITSLLCAALLAWGIPSQSARPAGAVSAAPATAPSRSFLETLGCHRLVLGFVLANFFFIAPLMGLEYSVPLLVKREFGSTLAMVGVVYTINAACILGLSFFIERLVRGRSELAVMPFAGVFWAAGLAILLTGFSVPALLVCTAVWTVGEILASILVPTYISRHVAPQVKGRFLSLHDAVRSLAGVLSPLGLGILWEAQGAPAVLTLLLTLPMAGILAYGAIWLGSTARRTAVVPAP